MVDSWTALEGVIGVASTECGRWTFCTAEGIHFGLCGQADQHPRLPRCQPALLCANLEHHTAVHQAIAGTIDNQTAPTLRRSVQDPLGISVCGKDVGSGPPPVRRIAPSRWDPPINIVRRRGSNVDVQLAIVCPAEMRSSPTAMRLGRVVRPFTMLEAGSTTSAPSRTGRSPLDR